MKKGTWIERHEAVQRSRDAHAKHHDDTRSSQSHKLRPGSKKTDSKGTGEDTEDSDRRPSAKGTLWDPASATPQKKSTVQPDAASTPSRGHPHAHVSEESAREAKERSLMHLIKEAEKYIARAIKLNAGLAAITEISNELRVRFE